MTEFNCELCQKIVFSNEDGVKINQPACIVRAAMKHIDMYYENCGQIHELGLPTPQEVIDANQFAGIIDAEVVEKPKRKKRNKHQK